METLTVDPWNENSNNTNSTSLPTQNDTPSITEIPFQDFSNSSNNATSVSTTTVPPLSVNMSTTTLASIIDIVTHQLQNLSTTVTPQVSSSTEDPILHFITFRTTTTILPSTSESFPIWNASMGLGQEGNMSGPVAAEEIEMMSTVGMVLTLFPLALITLFIILGNLLVVVAVFSKRSLRTPQNIYIVSLAMTDMGVALLVLPFSITTLVLQKWIFGLTLCKVHLLLDVALCTVSIFHLCAIGFDRYRAITEGIHYVQKRNLRSVLTTILTLWIIALWIGSPLLLAGNADWEIRFNGVSCDMPASAGFNFHLAVGALFFPLVIMTVIYVKIFNAIKERLRERAKVTCMMELTSDGDTTDKLTNTSVSEDEEAGTPKNARGTGKRKPSAQIATFLINKQKFSLSKERKAARTLGIIMAAFIFCWLPLGFLNVIGSLCPEGMKPSQTLFHIFTWLGYVNSALNPVIYAVSNQEYQKAFRRILHLDN